MLWVAFNVCVYIYIYDFFLRFFSDCMLKIGLLPEADWKFSLQFMALALVLQGLACSEWSRQSMGFASDTPKLATPAPQFVTAMPFPACLWAPMLVPALLVS